VTADGRGSAHASPAPTASATTIAATQRAATGRR
jgi:hypothetical protein